MVKKKPTKKMGYLRLVAILLLVLLTVAGTLVLLTFERTSGFARPEISPADWLSQSRLVMATMNRILKSKPGERATVKLSPDEVNTLLRFAGNGDYFAHFFRPGNGAKTAGAVSFQAFYRDGEFEIHYAHDLGLGAFRPVVRVRGSASYRDNTLSVVPVWAKAGALPLPPGAVKWIFDRVWTEAEQNRDVKRFHQSVDSITVDDRKRLIVEYRPNTVKQWIQGDLK